MNKKKKGNIPVDKKMIKRISFLIIIWLILPLNVMAIAQSKITLKVNNEPISKVLKKISRKSGVSIVFNEVFFSEMDRVSLDVTNVPYEKVLGICLKNTKYSYQIENNFILIKKKNDNKNISDTRQNIIISGKVTDINKIPLPFVTVYSKETRTGVTTNEEGFYEIFSKKGNVLIFSLLGYEGQEIEVTGETNIINVVLKEDIKALEEVVITGIIKRKKESFTGATTRISGKELVEVGTRNILQSIKNIDASFRIDESLEFGSDPNRFPDINIRGKSSLPDLTGSFSGNPNQPLFILDGFETTIDRVYDLDMDRIKSITLLKDASAKAIYGSKAGNGVVVIETIEPEKGKLRVNYTSRLSIEAPDLTGYNLMNAKEKLAWESSHNMYKASIIEIQNYRENVYNQFYQDVYTKGVDTYWLSQPIETGIGHRQSISLEGGDNSIRYSASFFYNDISGAMKGSSRKTYTGNSGLSYRKDKFTFKNVIEFSQNTATDSPYGNFSEYIGLNPYFQPFDERGHALPIAGFYPAGSGDGSRQNFFNPLYNAQLNVIDENSYLRISDNFYAEWNMAKGLRLTGTLGYTYQKNDGDNFTPPSHTDFFNYTEENGLIDYKGKWIRTEGFYKSIQSNIGINYNKSINNHALFANATFNLSDIESQTNTYVGEGFGWDSVSDISLSNYYQRASSPSGSDTHDRSVGVVGIINYSYDNRFLLDLSFRTSGSSLYGENNRWGEFWSVGTGYNIHNESFIENLNVFDLLKLRGSLGYTGSQNANSYNSIATYEYLDISYSGYKGAILKGLPNPNLAWQKVMDYNLGLDVKMLNNKISLRFDLYKKTTDNLLQSIDGAPSIGFPAYIANIGETTNKGIEFALRYQFFNNSADKSYLNISLTGTSIKNKLTKLSDAFTSYNKDIDKNAGQTSGLQTKPVARFYEGQSLDAIWAMRSLGIDPATGAELFLDKDGYITYDWSADDLAIVGDSQPKINGTISIAGGYNGFTFGVNGSYKFGGQLYNSTLVQRVENIDGRSNLDKRIYDAWYQPGDIAIYKKPEVGTNSSSSRSTTRPTSRFVQNNDEFYLSSLNMGYDFQNKAFLNNLGLDRLRLTATMNDILRISSIEIERGTSYPFSRNFSFSLNASF